MRRAIAWFVIAVSSPAVAQQAAPAPEEVVTAWARSLVQAVRSTGASQPISTGDGAWGVEVSGRDDGYSLRALAPLVDFFGPHSYPMLDDVVRQALAPALACELAGSFGRPVVLEEFGVSSDFAADEHAAQYYRQVLHTSLLAGARGWIAWNNCDYDDLRADSDLADQVIATGELPQILVEARLGRVVAEYRNATIRQARLQQGAERRAVVTRMSGDELRDGYVWNGFDYVLQVWVVDGVVQRCGHPAAMSRLAPCCAALVLAGQRIDQIPSALRRDRD